MNALYSEMYGLTLSQTEDLIAAIGDKRTVMISGHIGTGKSTLLKILGERFPDHHCAYFDCTTKLDSGDIQLPSINSDERDNKYVEYLISNELGLHHGKPIILNFDEFGKAPHSVQLASLRIMLERVIADKPLPEGSIVFGCTNLQAEGVKDMLPPHAMNRMIHVEMRKPDNMEWLTDFAVNNNIHPIVMSWVKDTEALSQDFREVKDPDDNKFIYHPKRVGGGQFATWRSIHACSDLMWVRDQLDDTTLTSAIVGAIGQHAGMDLMTRILIHDQLPSQESICTDPHNALVPESAAAQMMIMFRGTTNLNKSWIVNGWLDNLVTYIGRLSAEAQDIFAMSVLNKKYAQRDVIGQSVEFKRWAVAHKYIVSADQ